MVKKLHFLLMVFGMFNVFCDPIALAQNQSSDTKNDKEIIQLRDRVFSAIELGYPPNPNEEEKKFWKKKGVRKCGANYIANLPQFYATEQEHLSIVLVNLLYGVLPSVDSSQVDYDLNTKTFKVKNYTDIFTGCDGCQSEIATDTIYTGKLPAGEYTVFYEKNCNGRKGLEALLDTLYFTIYSYDSEEEVAKMKLQKIQEQIPENLPPRFFASRKYWEERILIQYTMTQPSELKVEVYNLSGTERYTLMESILQTKLGYNELRLSVPEDIKRENKENPKEDRFKIVFYIGETKHESWDTFYWQDLKK